MSKWEAPPELVRLFHSVGRVLLLNDMEDSHSGNIAMRWKDGKGKEYLVITSTGSQKGDLDARQICFLSTTETDHGYYKASSETDIHARILSLPDAAASIHAHASSPTKTVRAPYAASSPGPSMPVTIGRDTRAAASRSRPRSPSCATPTSMPRGPRAEGASASVAAWAEAAPGGPRA